MRNLLAIAVTLGALGAGCCTGGASSPPPPASGGARPSQRVAGEYIVTLAPGADPKAIEAAFGAVGVRRVQDLGANMYRVTVAEDPGPDGMEALGRKDPRIRAVQPNFVYRGG